jgi:hypothetical protein
LLALLSQLLAALALSYESRIPWMLSMMSAGLGEFPAERVAVEEVPRLLNVRGSGKTVHERNGIITVVDGIARLTERGRRLAAAHRPALEAVEADWAAQDGPEGLAAVRRHLEPVAADLPSRHVRHLQMQYVKGGRAYKEANPR